MIINFLLVSVIILTSVAINLQIMQYIFEQVNRHQEMFIDVNELMKQVKGDK